MNPLVRDRVVCVRFRKCLHANERTELVLPSDNQQRIRFRPITVAVAVTDSTAMLWAASWPTGTSAKPNQNGSSNGIRRTWVR